MSSVVFRELEAFSVVSFVLQYTLRQYSCVALRVTSLRYILYIRLSFRMGVGWSGFLYQDDFVLLAPGYYANYCGISPRNPNKQSYVSGSTESIVLGDINR